MQRDFLLDLFKNCDFDALTAENVEEQVIYNLPENFSYDYSFGISKVCIIPMGADYVIKIPFRGQEMLDDEKPYGETYYKDFNGANTTTHSYWDYCLTEVSYYNEAKKEHINKCFCKTRLLGFINNYPIYIQERACTFREKNGDDLDYRSEKSIKMKRYCEEHCFRCFDPEWLADAFEYYGLKTFNKLMNFIYEYNITDLHTDNIGYIGTRPVILDFSDFLG
jgi:hypothetical protein